MIQEEKEARKILAELTVIGIPQDKIKLVANISVNNIISSNPHKEIGFIDHKVVYKLNIDFWNVVKYYINNIKDE